MDGMAHTQPMWAVSLAPVGNVLNTTESEDQFVSLTCASEHTSTLDAVILTLPWKGGALFYTADGVERSFEITEVPTIVNNSQLIYNSGSLGADGEDVVLHVYSHSDMIWTQIWTPHISLLS